MKTIRILVLCFIVACGTININSKWDNKTIYNPIVDSMKKIHDYNTSIKLELHENYSLYCIRHQTWEIVRVKYYKDTDSIYYMVSDAWPR